MEMDPFYVDFFLSSIIDNIFTGLDYMSNMASVL